MKLLHEYEDCFVGIIIGILIVGLSGYFFTLPQWNTVFAIIFIVSALFTIFDFFYTLSDLGKKIIPILFIFLNNLIDVILEVSLAAFYFNYNIPFLSEFINPFLEDPFVLLIIGAFFIITSIFWIIATPIIWKDDKSGSNIN